MSEIDTSAAAIEATKSFPHHLARIVDDIREQSTYAAQAHTLNRAADAICTLLAALAEREGLHKEQQAVAVKAIASRDADISSLRQQLAAHDACLTQVREEMPEVAEVRQRHWQDLDDLRRIGADTLLAQGDGWESPNDIRILLKVIDTLQQNEARWRNSRDVWDAERKRLQELAEERAQQRDAVWADRKKLREQLSASNAACAVMRQGLEIAEVALK